MVQRRHPTSHWIILLAKVLFLQSIAVSTIHAAVLTEGISANSVVKDTAFSSKPSMNTLVSNTNDLHSNDNKLVQSDSKRYNPNDNSGLDLYLDVMLNGASKGLIHFVYHDDRLWATTAVLQQMGFILPQDVNDTIPLKSLPNLEIDYDMRQQSLELIAPLSMLNLDTTIRSTRTNKRPIPTVSPGLLLNYNVHATQNHHNAKNLSAYTELRAFNAHGVVSSTALTTINRSPDSVSLDGEWKGQTVRLDTSWSQSFPDKLLTVRAGDILTGALSWTRSTRLGGLQIGTNFDLQPYRSTTPLPSFFGSATLPSEVELYVNGLEHYRGQVPAGPFELKTAPSISGAGTAQLVVTDALGQSTTLNYSLYDTHRLLQPELLDWSLELGAVRESYGIDSFDYGDTIAASGTLRYGVSNNFTAEAHAEVVHGLSNAGVGGTWLLGRAGGILFASIAGSDSQGEDGIQYSTNYSWNNNRFSIGFNALGTQGVYRDVGSQYGAAPVRRSEQISTGYSSRSLGSFGLSYNQTTQAEMESTKFVSAYWSKAFGKRLNLNMNYNHDLNHSASSNISIGASLSLDRNMSISSSMQHTDEHNVMIADISKSVERSGGIDWRAQVRRSAATNSATLLDKNIENHNSVSALAELSYLGRYGRVQGGISSIDNQYATYASGIGSLVMMGGGIFPARQIDNGFAVVSTGDIANVPVLLQNNPVGTTNKHGLLLVTSLNAYQNNKIGIDPMQLPADMRINKVSIELHTHTYTQPTCTHIHTQSHCSFLISFPPLVTPCCRHLFLLPLYPSIV